MTRQEEKLVRAILGLQGRNNRVRDRDKLAWEQVIRVDMIRRTRARVE